MGIVDKDIQNWQNMINFFLKREASVRVLTIDIVNLTYHPHNNDKIEPHGLADIALTRSFRGDP